MFKAKMFGIVLYYIIVYNFKKAYFKKLNRSNG